MWMTIPPVRLKVRKSTLPSEAGGKYVGGERATLLGSVQWSKGFIQEGMLRKDILKNISKANVFFIYSLSFPNELDLNENIS